MKLCIVYYDPASPPRQNTPYCHLSITLTEVSCVDKPSRILGVESVGCLSWKLVTDTSFFSWPLDHYFTHCTRSGRRKRGLLINWSCLTYLKNNWIYPMLLSVFPKSHVLCDNHRLAITNQQFTTIARLSKRRPSIVTIYNNSLGN